MLSIISIIILVLIALYWMIMIWYTSGWISLSDKVNAEGDLPQVTVIIPMRNEEDAIVSCLTSISQQDYPKEKFRIVVVDDNSTDRSVELVRSLGLDNLHLIEMKNDDGEAAPYKKMAIQKAIEASDSEFIITTDADCVHGMTWLYSMMNSINGKKADMAVGPVMIEGRGFGGAFQSLDFAGLGAIAGASIHHGFYNLCSGANLAYRRQAFFDVDGFKGIDDNPSGDDMFLMHKMAKAGMKVIYSKNRGSLVVTKAEPDLRSFWHQRLRWASKSTEYEDKRITLILIMTWFVNLGIPVALVLALICSQFLPVFILAVLFKLLGEFFLLGSFVSFFKRSRLLWLFLPAQILHIPYVLLIGLFSTIGTYRWKDRVRRK